MSGHLIRITPGQEGISERLRIRGDKEGETAGEAHLVTCETTAWRKDGSSLFRRGEQIAVTGQIHK
jgi:hypothetical protein